MGREKNKCGCGKTIPRGATHCGPCARTGGGYRSNMAAELAQADRNLAAKRAMEALSAAKKSEARKAAQKRQAERVASARAATQKRKLDGAERQKQLKLARTLSNVRAKPEAEKPKKKGWW